MKSQLQGVGEGKLDRKAPGNVNGNSNRQHCTWCLCISRDSLDPKPLHIHPSLEIPCWSLFKVQPSGDLEDTWSKPDPLPGALRATACGPAGRLSGPERTEQCSVPQGLLGASREIPRPLAQVAGKRPLVPPDHIAGNPEHLVPSDATYAAAHPKDRGSMTEEVLKVLT